MSDLLTITEVAQILRVDHTTVRRWVKQGVLEVVTLPHMNTRQGYRIKRKTLDEILGKGNDALAQQEKQSSGIVLPG
jgi:excisionase family DNA binding protein